MTQSPKANRKDVVLIITGTLILIALLFFPLLCLVGSLIEVRRGSEPWAALGFLLLFPGIILSLLMGLIGAIISLPLRSRGVAAKWFLLCFDVTGLGYAAGFLYSFFCSSRLGDLDIILYLPCGLVAGSAALTVLILRARRLTAEIPPSQKPSRKDLVLVVIGTTLLLLLLTPLVGMLIEALTSLSFSVDENWVMYADNGLFYGAVIAAVTGRIGLFLAKKIQRPLLGLKWFLFAFDAPALAYGIGLLLISNTSLISFLSPRFLLVLSVMVGVLILLLLVRTKSRLLAQNPPGQPQPEGPSG
jgi:hypothetical protein